MKTYTTCHDSAGTHVPSDVKSSYPGPKDQRIRGAFLTMLHDERGNLCYHKWRTVVQANSFNLARGGRKSDNKLSPMYTTKESQTCYHTSKKNLTIVVINAGKIMNKQYYMNGNQPIPKWLTRPTLDNDDWTNPDVDAIANGLGDVFLIQEAEGFEDNGAIAKRLLSHSMKPAYFQKGKAPPLAVVAKGPLADDIRFYGDAAEELSGQRPAPEDEISIVILACDTIPWGGVKDFTNHHQPNPHDIPHDNLRRHQREAPPTDGSSSSEDAPDAPEEDHPGPTVTTDEAKLDWAGTYMIAQISFGPVTLHNNDQGRTLPVGRFFNTQMSAYDNVYAWMLKTMAPWQAKRFNTRVCIAVVFQD